MDRRELVRSLAAVVALPFVPTDPDAALGFATALHERSGGQQSFRTLSSRQQRLVADLVDRIIPATDVPGALAVGVPEFIDLLLTEWFDASDRDRLLEGLADIDRRSAADGGASFSDLPEARKLTLMRTLDASPRDEEEGAAAAFGRIKALTVYGYFTSELVSKEVLRTQVYFEDFDGCAPVGG